MRRILMLGFLALAMALAACGDDDGEWVSEADDDPAGSVEATDDAADEPTPTPEPDPTPTPAISAGVDQDPRDVLVALMQDQEDPDLELVYQYLSERFQVLEFQEDWVRGLAPTRHADYQLSAEDLLLEEYEGFSVVRPQDLWIAKWVFVEEDGEWRLEPGDERLLIAAGRLQAGPDQGFSFGMAMPDDYQATSESDPDDGLMMGLIQGQPIGVGVQDGFVDVAMRWELQSGRPGPGEPAFDSHFMEDTLIPLDQITWYAGEKSGPVDVYWTDGGVVDDQIVFPGWPDEEMAREAAGDAETLHFMRYGLSLRLYDLPDDAGEIILAFDEVRVGPIGDDHRELEGQVVTYQYEFTFPAETTDPILVGEAPEAAVDPEVSDPLPPPSEDDLPPAPSLDEVLRVAEVNYETGADSVEARITLDPGEIYFEFPGPAEVIWDDGVVTETIPMMQGREIELTTERDEPPFDAEVRQIRFEQLVRSLEIDESATIEQSSIATMWGDFPYSVGSGGESINYEPVGQRWIRGMTIQHDDHEISTIGSGASFDEDFRPTEARLEARVPLEDLLDDLPLNAVVEVWQAERDVELEIE